jgi:predicted nucleic acid-binding protein
LKYLLDTNVLSEMQKPDCNPTVKAFTDGIPPDELFLCALTIGELCFGIERLPPGKKKHELSIWLYTQLPVWFRNRVIPLDDECMLEWGRLCAKTKRPLPYKDSLIAAAAITNHLTLIARNVKDFENIGGLSLINPWENAES